MTHSSITQISAHSRNPEERSLSLALTNRRPRRPPITPLPSLPSFVLPSFVSVGGGVAYFRAKAAFPNRRGERKWKEGRREGRWVLLGRSDGGPVYRVLGARPGYEIGGGIICNGDPPTAPYAHRPCTAKSAMHTYECLLRL